MLMTKLREFCSESMELNLHYSFGFLLHLFHSTSLRSCVFSLMRHIGARKRNSAFIVEGRLIRIKSECIETKNSSEKPAGNYFALIKYQ